MEQNENTPQEYIPYNPNPKTLTWERLETMRLRKLGLASNKYSRHFNVLRTSRRDSMRNDGTTLELAGSCGASPREAQVMASKLSKKESKSAGPTKSTKMNSIAPFATVEKPTCGYFFNFRTDNKKIKFGIPASDLVKWRNFNTQPAN